MTPKEILMEDLRAELASVREQMDILTVKFKDAKISVTEYSSVSTLLTSRRMSAQAKLERLLDES